MVSNQSVALTTYHCGIGPAFAAIGGKWKAAVLWELRGGPLRYGELKRRMDGVTEKMLIQQLRDLERDQLLTRQVYPQVPPRVEYDLTEWGVRLNAALGPIADWGAAYAKATGKYPET
ncbi:MAG: helix-turn-helix domain-containing protein [Caulobacter sp.]